ncbi:MAG: hypothetical protein H0X40_16635 [Chthoniobacterales bacterium]|nr:hypothetical protein [Chthoniobacterales bacterium]
MKTYLLITLAFSLCLASAQPVAAGIHAILWSADTGMQDLGTLGGDMSYATAVNDNGVVVGYSYTADGAGRAFLWTTASGMQDLGVPAGANYSSLVAESINNKNEIVGYAFSGGGLTTPFYWTATAGFTVFTPGSGEAYGINDPGTVTGLIDQHNVEQTFLWQPSRDIFRGLGFPFGQPYSVGMKINNAGNIAGQLETDVVDFHPMFWSRATGFVDLGVPAALYNGVGYGINKVDEVVGETWNSQTGASVAAFYWNASAGRVALTPLPNRVSTAAYGINNKGMIAGVSASDDSRFPTRAVIWKNYTSDPQDLGTLPGGTISAGSAINNLGQVAGYADVP